MRTLWILAIVLALLVGTNYLHAWTTAPNNPPNSNVAAPINTSGVSQVKTGPLGTGSLDVTGLQSITHNNPIIRFTDMTLGEMDYRLVINGNGMWFQVDRNDDAQFTALDGRNALVLHSSSTSAVDYALFSNQVRAAEYCDRGGNNCFLASDVGGGGGPGGGGVNLTAGNGITLTPNPITANGSIAVNTTVVQSRVTGTCPVGQAIRAVNANGTVVCQPISGTNTVYSCPVIDNNNNSIPPQAQCGIQLSTCTGQLQITSSCSYVTNCSPRNNTVITNHAVSCTRVGHLVP